MDLPVYYLELNEGDGLTQVSLVNAPAIEENFHAFAAQAEAFTFAIQSEEKRIITGPAMLAERPIYRRGPDGSEFYVKFSAATIEKAVRMWATQGKYNAVNVEHSAPVGGLFLIECFMTDPIRGISPPQAWKDAEPGSWFLSYYVQDDALWAKVKSGEFKGFSIEGYFTDKPAGEDAESLATMRALTQIFRESSEVTLSEMNAKEQLLKIRALLGFSEEQPAEPTPVAFGEGQLADGTAIRWQGETLESGALLEVMLEDGTFAPAPDGTHETADGQLVTTEGGIVTEIMLKENEAAPAEDMTEAFSALEAKYAALETKFAAQNTAVETLVARIEKLFEAQKNTLDVIEQFSAIPSADPTQNRTRSRF
jgi:hypothetical protein